MEKIRELALSSYVYQQVKTLLHIDKRNVSDFLIDIARKSSSLDDFIVNLKTRKVTLPIELSRNIFNIVQRHGQFQLSEEAKLPITMTMNPMTLPIEKPEIGEIYRGRVTSVTAHGVFIKIDEFPGKPTGFCHVKEMRADPLSDVKASEILNIGEKVFAKVLEPVGNKLTLSIRGIDQTTGKNADELFVANIKTFDGGARTRRLKSPERFEFEQLMNSGALKANEIMAFSGDNGILSRAAEVEEDFEIALNTKVPPFLANLKREKKISLPSQVISNPEGSLARAAREVSRISKERQEQRRLQSQVSHGPSTVGLLDDEEAAISNTKLEGLPEWKKQSFKSFGPKNSDNSRQKLPIYDFKDAILQMIVKHRVFILVGETGCGKTTQIPQYLYEWGVTKKKIAVTQPRRVAAISVAKRVAHEMDCNVGGLVGYCVRFEESLSESTRIKFVTDGMLLKECLSDRTLSEYGIVMLDEAHERTIHTDVLFGLMKKILEDDKSDLKVIVTSATLQQEKFSEFFFDCPVLTIPGRTYPVQTSYATKSQMNYLDFAVQTVLSLHCTEPKPGDILLFLTGQDDIDTACELIFQKGKVLENQYGPLIVLPIYSTLPSEQQSMIFEPTPAGSRKVVVATNIAETSITIDGIRYVVDPGFVKELWYDPKIGMDTLKVVPISKAAANQRKGRAGRTAEGKCIRLYTEEAFNKEMKDASVPEIQRSNMAMVSLQLIAMGIDDLINFEFMDKPPTHTIIDALEQLYALEAVDDEGHLTTIGRKMAQFPLNPQLSKMLIASGEMGCSEEIMTIVAILSVQGIWYRPRQKQANADAMKARLNREEGDHLTLLHAYREWVKAGRSEQWCKDNYVHFRSLKRADDVIEQLRGLMERFHLNVASCGNDTQTVLKAIVSGFFAKAARKDGQKGYRTLVDDHLVHMFPGSALFGRDPDYVIFHELVNTTKEFMRNTVMVEPRWLVELAPKFYRKASAAEITQRKKNERLTPLGDQRRDHDRDWRITEQRIVRL
ncbi:ATP-dependent RNA helicase dhx8 [Tritrichomonas musculus]|uniref:RNA helicase n=1 Tax=Tritrichomonas musculus TaxID=1915356 RepID=A0ABR2K3L9_9EUKA